MLINLAKLTPGDIPKILDAVNVYLVSTAYTPVTKNIFITTRQLALRWEISASRLNQYRVIGEGAPYTKIGTGIRGKVRYPLLGKMGLLQYENKNTFRSTTEWEGSNK